MEIELMILRLYRLLYPQDHVIGLYIGSFEALLAFSYNWNLLVLEESFRKIYATIYIIENIGISNAQTVKITKPVLFSGTVWH